MLSIKQKYIEIAAVTIVLSIMLLAGQMEANAGKEDRLLTEDFTPPSDEICCIENEPTINKERAKELTFGPIQCPTIPLTVTLTTINEQMTACLFHNKHNELKHILNGSAQQAPSMPYKSNHRSPKRVKSKPQNTPYKAPDHIKF